MSYTVYHNVVTNAPGNSTILSRRYDNNNNNNNNNIFKV